MKTEETKRYILESYLLTGNDFADYQVAVRRMKTGRGELLLFRLCGMALIFLSLLGRVFFTNDTTYDSAVYFLLLCLGVGICLYYASYKGRMLANHVEFDGRGIRFVTDMGREEIPYEKLRRAYEDKRVILLEEEQGIRFLPKRVLTMDEYKGVRGFLKRALQENYLQEGVC